MLIVYMIHMAYVLYGIRGTTWDALCAARVLGVVKENKSAKLGTRALALPTGTILKLSSFGPCAPPSTPSSDYPPSPIETQYVAFLQIQATLRPS